MLLKCYSTLLFTKTHFLIEFILPVMIEVKLPSLLMHTFSILSSTFTLWTLLSISHCFLFLLLTLYSLSVFVSICDVESALMYCTPWKNSNKLAISCDIEWRTCGILALFRNNKIKWDDVNRNWNEHKRKWATSSWNSKWNFSWDKNDDNKLKKNGKFSFLCNSLLNLVL